MQANLSVRVRERMQMCSVRVRAALLNVVNSLCLCTAGFLPSAFYFENSLALCTLVDIRMLHHDAERM